MLHKRERLQSSGSASVSQALTHKESFFAIGTVTVRPFRMVDGVKVYIEDQASRHNLIVRKGREGLIDLLIGIKPKKLKFIRWGRGGAPSFPAGDPLQPYVVQDADLDVTAFLLDKQLNAPTRVSVTEVSYTETLISDEINSDVNEAAILFEDQTTFDRIIFARITFPTVRLTSDRGVGIELQWVFNFSRAEEV